jgi:hypothetical protein
MDLIRNFIQNNLIKLNFNKNLESYFVRESRLRFILQNVFLTFATPAHEYIYIISASSDLSITSKRAPKKARDRVGLCARIKLEKEERALA